jgi:hypothetical protein
MAPDRLRFTMRRLDPFPLNAAITFWRICAAVHFPPDLFRPAYPVVISNMLRPASLSLCIDQVSP